MAKHYLAALLVFICIAAYGHGPEVKLATAKMPTGFIPAMPGEGRYHVSTTIPGAGATLFAGPDGWTVARHLALPHGSKAAQDLAKKLAAAKPRGTAWRMSFVGAAPLATPRLEGQGSIPITRISAQGTATAFPAAAATHDGIYPGIDATLSLANNALSYSIYLNPGADAATIAIAYDGLPISQKAGMLVVDDPISPVYFTAPKAYQILERDGKVDTVWVPCKYRVKGQTVRFALGRYNKTKLLTIDPTLVFSTYSGSTVDNWGSSATYDDAGHMFSAGIVFGDGFPVTRGVLDSAWNSSVDIGILKYSADGHNLLWATLLGGRGTDNPTSMVAGPDERLYVLSVTGSADYPTTAGAVQSRFRGGPREDPMGYYFYQGDYFPRGSDVAISCIAPDGRSLLASTYLGGSNTDGILRRPDSSDLTNNYGDQYRGEIILDRYGRVCVATNTFSQDFPGLDAGNAGTRDAVVVRLDSNLTTVEAGRRIGGPAEDAGFGIHEGLAGALYVTGSSSSNGFTDLSGLGTLHPANAGGTDAFVARLDSNLRVTAYTYLGTPAKDNGFLVQTDQAGNVYVLGQSDGDYPATDSVYSQGQGQFIHCLTPGLDSTVFSTHIGNGQASLTITAFLVDDCERIYFAGWGGITNGEYNGGTNFNFPTTPDAYKPFTDGSDFYLAVLGPRARRLSYATFFGADNTLHGEHVDGGTSRFSRKGVVYQAICGCGGSASILPTTPGAWSQTNNSDNCNNAGFKFDFSLIKAQAAVRRVQGCAPFTATFYNNSTNASAYYWRFDTAGHSTSTDSSVSFTFRTPGRYRVTLIASNPGACNRIDSVTLFVTATAFAHQVNLRDTTLKFCTQGQRLTLASPGGPFTYTWAPNRNISDSSAQNPVFTPSATISYTQTLRDSLGCEQTRQVQILNGLPPTLTLFASRNLQSCGPVAVSANVTAGIGNQVRWFQDRASVPFATHDTVFINNYYHPGRSVIYVTAHRDTACVPDVRDSIVIHQDAPLGLSITPPPRGCPGDQIFLHAEGDTVAARLNWVDLATRDTIGHNARQSVPFSPGARYALYADRGLCADSQTVTLRPAPQITYTLQPRGDIVSCGPNPIRAMVATDPLNQVGWYFGPNASGPQYTGDTLDAPNYFQTGRSVIYMRIYRDSACVPMLVDSLVIHQEAAFNLSVATPPPACPGDTLTLRASGDSANASFTWTALASPTDTLARTQGVAIAYTPGLALAMHASRGLCQADDTVRLRTLHLTADVHPLLTPADCQDTYSLLVEYPRPNYSISAVLSTGQALPMGADAITLPAQAQPLTLISIATLRGCADSAFTQIDLPSRAIPAPRATPGFALHYGACSGLPNLQLFQADTQRIQISTFYEGTSPIGAPPYTLKVPDTLPHAYTLIAQIGPCTDTSTVTVAAQSLYIGNIITPNGDGKNDALMLPDGLANARVEVDDRWGRRWYLADTYKNGDFPPANLVNGTYVYYLDTPEGLKCRGWVEIIK